MNNNEKKFAGTVIPRPRSLDDIREEVYNAAATSLCESIFKNELDNAQVGNKFTRAAHIEDIMTNNDLIRHTLELTSLEMIARKKTNFVDNKNANGTISDAIEVAIKYSLENNSKGNDLSDSKIGEIADGIVKVMQETINSVIPQTEKIR